jgi:hypothetical protein
MNREDFNKIVLNQVKVTTKKDLVNAYSSIFKVCSTLNLKAYTENNKWVKPVKEYNEIRLIEQDDTYSYFLKLKDPFDTISIVKVWYGKYDKYLIKNIGDNCHIVYEMKMS